MIKINCLITSMLYGLMTRPANSFDFITLMLLQLLYDLPFFTLITLSACDIRQTCTLSCSLLAHISERRVCAIWITLTSYRVTNIHQVLVASKKQIREILILRQSQSIHNTIGHVNVQSCLLIIFQYQTISLQCF